MKLTNQDKLILGFFGISLLIIIGLLIFFNTGDRAKSNISGNVIANNREVVNNLSQEQTQQTSEIKKHIPVNLSKDDVLVSFRIDDITFETKQKQVLENALYLARKYNITFDLVVIAKPFDEKADPEVFKIYQDNQDVFEVVAHGLTHKNPIDSSIKSEFTGVPVEIQEQQIKQMKDIFEKHNLTMATKILALPWHAGDEQTILLAKEYGYKVIIINNVTKNNFYDYIFNGLIVSKSWIAPPMNESLNENDFSKSLRGLNYLIKEKNQTRVYTVLHPINFYKIENSEELINRIIKFSKENPKIKFGFISDRLER